LLQQMMHEAARHFYFTILLLSTSGARGLADASSQAMRRV
jgi:hypothetical protein